LARLGLRCFIKRGAKQQTLAQSRRTYALFDALVPKPPRSTQTRAIDAGGVKADLIVTPASRSDRHILFLHGGGYTVGSPVTYRHFTWRVAAAAKARLLAIDYRLAPEHPLPAALEDALASYRWLLAGGAASRQIVVAGDSSGGGLALGLLLKLRDDGLPLPAAAVVLSPWTDLALTGTSLVTNADADPMLNASELPALAAAYLGGADPRNSYASPLYGDPAGLPPTLIHVGGDEILHDDAVRMAEKMRVAGCAVELEIWPCMPHVWHLLAPFVPEANAANARIGGFVERIMQGRG
jgi:acetyl esterase/lipase